MLDAFTGDYIPEHLMTREFLEEVSAALTEDGVLVANTFASSALYDAETATYAAVFPALAEVRLDETLNRILVAQKRPFPSAEDRQAAAEALRRPLRRFASLIPYRSPGTSTWPRALPRARGCSRTSTPPLTFCSSSSRSGQGREVRAAEFMQ